MIMYIYIYIIYTINIDHRCIDLYVHIPFRFSAHWAHPTCKLHLDLWSIWPQPWPIRPMLSDPPDPSPSLGPPAPSPFWFRFSSNVETSHSPDLNPKKALSRTFKAATVMSPISGIPKFVPSQGWFYEILQIIGWCSKNRYREVNRH